MAYLLSIVKGVVSNPSINQPTNGNLGHLSNLIIHFDWGCSFINQPFRSTPVKNNNSITLQNPTKRPVLLVPIVPLGWDQLGRQAAVLGRMRDGCTFDLCSGSMMSLCSYGRWWQFDLHGVYNSMLHSWCMKAKTPFCFEIALCYVVFVYWSVYRCIEGIVGIANMFWKGCCFLASPMSLWSNCIHSQICFRGMIWWMSWTAAGWWLLSSPSETEDRWDHHLNKWLNNWTSWK